MSGINIIKKGDLVFDVGANVGNKSKEYLTMGASVIAFEPQFECYQELKKLPIDCENIALGEKKGIENLFISETNTLSSMSEDYISAVKQERFKDNMWGGAYTVQTDTLDNMVDKYGTPKYIKIDVEGYELNVLKGLTKPIEYISVEFTPEFISETIKCIDYLPKSLYNYISQENDYFTFIRWLERDEMVAFLQSITDHKIEFGDVYIHRKM